MNLNLIIVIGGIAGTLLMTAFVYAVASIKNKNWKVIKVLGTMLCRETTAGGGLSNSKESITAGTVLHYAIGVLFAFIYQWLWHKGIGEPTLHSALIFGILNGIVGAAGWLIFFRLHKHPPKIKLAPYVVLIGSSHLLFALGFVACYRWAINFIN